MKLHQITKPITTLALLAIVAACNPNESSQEKPLAKSDVVAVEDKQRGGPSHSRPSPGGKKRTACEALQQGPTKISEHGPMDNTDLNRDGTVLREELDTFMDQGVYRRITILTFFEQFDTNKDGQLDHEEFAKVDPPHSFDGTDSDGDCVVSREEVVAYAGQAGRSYRKIGLEKFFDLIDSNGDNKVTPTEVEAAHESGLLARF